MRRFFSSHCKGRTPGPPVRPDESSVQLSSSPLVIYYAIFSSSSSILCKRLTFSTGISVKNKIGFRLQSNFTKFLWLSVSCSPLTRTTAFSERIVCLQGNKINRYCYLMAVRTKTQVSLSHEAYLALDQCFPVSSHLYTTCITSSISVQHLHCLYNIP